MRQLANRQLPGRTELAFAMESPQIFTIYNANSVARLRLRSIWFQFYSVCTSCSYLAQNLPFYLTFIKDQGRFIVKTSRVRKIIWLLFQLVGARIFWSEFVQAVMKIRSSHNSLLYFDLLSLLGWISVDYPFKYKWFFQTGLVQEFFDELQDSPLLQISSPRIKYVSAACSYSFPV